MSSLPRFVYFFYYLKQTQWRSFQKFLRHAAARTGKSRARIIWDSVASSFKHNMSLLDYFHFRFYQLSLEERQEWAGTGYMYEFQKSMNPIDSRNVLANKIIFLHRFKPFVSRGFAGLSDMKSDPRLVEAMLSNPSGKLVMKGSLGQVGNEVEVISCADLDSESLLSVMVKKSCDLVEEYVIQHPDMMALSPSGLNTVRICTQIHKNKVDILGARLRITVDSVVDNLAAGNLAAPIDPDSGVVNGPGIYSDITKEEKTSHPVTGHAIPGFRIPFWTAVLDLAKAAALHTPENRSVGWDIAVTSTGPELIEGNHNWCKLLWQLPVRKGLKGVLEKYKDESKRVNQANRWK